MILPRGSKDNGLNAIIASPEVDNNPNSAGFTDSPEGVEEMQNHFMDIHNPEIFLTSEPIDIAIKVQARQQAEAYLIADGFRLISEGKIAGLFPGSQ